MSISKAVAKTSHIALLWITSTYNSKYESNGADEAVKVFPCVCVYSVGVKGVQVEEIYDLQSKCQRYDVVTSQVDPSLFGKQWMQVNQGWNYLVGLLSNDVRAHVLNQRTFFFLPLVGLYQKHVKIISIIFQSRLWLHLPVQVDRGASIQEES